MYQYTDEICFEVYQFVKETWTVGDLVLKRDDIDCDPVHQRLNRDPFLKGRGEPSKAQGIIQSMLMGIDIGQITIHETPNGKYKYESIDGGHRKRYILAFKDNKFPEFYSNVYYRDLTEQEKDRFLNIEISFCIYKNLKPYQVGEIFRRQNKTTPVNHQEMLNSYGDIPIANSIRETVRTVPGVGNVFHSLFDYSQKNSSAEKVYTYINFNNNGLKIDEMVARIYNLYYKGGRLDASTDEDLEKMYRDFTDEKRVKQVAKSVQACHDFVLRMAQIRKKRLKNLMTQREYVLFYRMWIYLEHTYGNFVIDDEEAFFDAINKAYSPYKVEYKNQVEELRQISELDSSKTVGKQFNDSLATYKTKKDVEYSLFRILKEIDILSLITVRDLRRAFSKTDREAKLVEQNYKCYITGDPLDIKDAHAGHIIAWSNGGKTTYDNLAMICGKINTAMGTMSIEEYKEFLRAKNKKAV